MYVVSEACGLRLSYLLCYCAVCFSVGFGGACQNATSCRKLPETSKKLELVAFKAFLFIFKLSVDVTDNAQAKSMFQCSTSILSINNSNRECLN